MPARQLGTSGALGPHDVGKLVRSMEKRELYHAPPKPHDGRAGMAQPGHTNSRESVQHDCRARQITLSYITGYKKVEWEDDKGANTTIHCVSHGRARHALEGMFPVHIYSGAHHRRAGRTTLQRARYVM